MAVLSRDALEGSPLADLHLLATELGIDGFRRLRKAELVEKILSRQDGADTGEDDVEAAADFLAVRAVLRGEAGLPAGATLPEGLRRV